MANTNRDHAALAQKMALVLPYLDERQRRLLLAAEARILGRGGVQVVASATGVAERTIARGMRELETGEPEWGTDRVRRPGGGRKPTVLASPGIFAELDKIIDPDGADDAGRILRWTTRSTRLLAESLTERGHPVTHSAVAKLLRAADYHLPPPRKPFSATARTSHEAQFRHVSDRVAASLAIGEPVVGVWAARKEAAERTLAEDPRGISDATVSQEWAATECDHFTARCATSEIQRWWTWFGKPACPEAKKLTVVIGGVGVDDDRLLSNWCTEFAILAGSIGLALTIRHLPPATVKWACVRQHLRCQVIASSPESPPAAHLIAVGRVMGPPGAGHGAEEPWPGHSGNPAWNYSVP